MNQLLWKCAVVVGMAVVSAEASAVTLLQDNFDDGDLSTNTGLGGIGTGFTQHSHAGAGGTAVESGGTVNIKGNGASSVSSIQSDNIFNPAGLTLIWGINSAVQSGFSGVGMGWTALGTQPGGPNSVALEVRTDRLTFDLLAGGDFTRQINIPIGSAAANAVYQWDFASPLVATMTLNANDWSLSVVGTNVSINQSGLYSAFGPGGSQIAGGTNVTLASILSNAGSDLATNAYAVSAAGDVVVDYVTITAVPEPSTLLLIGIASLAFIRLRRSTRG